MDLLIIWLAPVFWVRSAGGSLTFLGSSEDVARSLCMGPHLAGLALLTWVLACLGSLHFRGSAL